MPTPKQKQIIQYITKLIFHPNNDSLFRDYYSFQGKLKKEYGIGITRLLCTKASKGVL